METRQEEEKRTRRNCKGDKAEDEEETGELVWRKETRGEEGEDKTGVLVWRKETREEGEEKLQGR